MSSPAPSGSAQSSGLSDGEQDVVYMPAGDVYWEDDDDMDYEHASESLEESLGESDFDETEYYG